MTDRIESVLCTAATPAQAKIYVALLQAQGIPARIEGESLADEFAASQRLMGLLGSRVFVPTSSLERARELLQPVAVPAEELEQMALSTPLETPPRPPSAPRAPDVRAWRWAAGLGSVAALVFAWLWVDTLEPEPPVDPLYWHERADGGWREHLRADGRLLRFLHDADGDGVYERIDQYDPSGRLVLVVDRLQHGFYRRQVEQRPDGTTVTWTDDDGDGLVERCEVRDAAGTVIQTLTAGPGGYLVK